MRLLLDESLPRGLKRHLSAHDVATVPEQGWAGKSNGELLRLAEEEFDAFLTADQNVEFQQNLRAYKPSLCWQHQRHASKTLNLWFQKC